MFGRATIRLGIGPHSSYIMRQAFVCCLRCMLQLSFPVMKSRTPYLHVVTLSVTEVSEFHHTFKSFALEAVSPTWYRSTVVGSRITELSVFLKSQKKIIAYLRNCHSFTTAPNLIDRIRWETTVVWAPYHVYTWWSDVMVIYGNSNDLYVVEQHGVLRRAEWWSVVALLE